MHPVHLIEEVAPAPALLAIWFWLRAFLRHIGQKVHLMPEGWTAQGRDRLFSYYEFFHFGSCPHTGFICSQLDPPSIRLLYINRATGECDKYKVFSYKGSGPRR